MDDVLFMNIVDLIETKMGRYNLPITRETCLEKDLGITGDDAVELLVEYSARFNVDVSKLDLSKYFTPEGDTILPAILRLITGKKEAKNSELTVGDLERGAITKQLSEEILTRN